MSDQPTSGSTAEARGGAPSRSTAETRAHLRRIDVGHREQALVDCLADDHLDALVVTNLSNIRWLTGFAGSNATVVAASDGQVTLLTDNRYADRAPRELAEVASTASVDVGPADLGPSLRTALAAARRVGLEADHVSWNQHRRFAQDWLPDHELAPSSGLIEGLRSVKDHAEIDRIEAAAAIVDRALSDVVAALLEQPTEREFARILDAAIRAGGADDLGFDTIVASGPNGAIPHHAPGDRTIGRGDLVIVDVGAMVDGYRSDMTRTFCVGELSAEQRRHYQVVADAQQAGVDAMVEGVRTAAVDAAARAVIGDAGWGDRFTHGTGHGVGLDIHELPRVAHDAADEYRIGTVATVEPGVYLPGVAGVRVEDTCVVTESGARRLTGFPKAPELA